MDKKELNGIYFIENTINEIATTVKGYFSTLDDAKEALKECNNWFRPKGTGNIYFREFGLNKPNKLVYKKY